MIVVCFCGARYEAEESVVCLTPACSEFGRLVRADAQEPTLGERLVAFEFAALIAGFQND